MIVDLIEAFYRLLWGDLFTLPVAGGIGISFMVVLLFAAGDRKSTRLNSSHREKSRMPSSA